MPDGSEQLLSHFFLKFERFEGTTDTDTPDEIAHDLQEVRIESSLHLPDVATIVLHDPSLKWVDDDRLEPGKTVQVFARFNQKEQKVFDGEIVEIEPEYLSETMNLSIRAFDRLHRLARGRHARSFLNVSDSDIIEKLAGEAGLKADVGNTPEVFEYVFQENETNLEFLQKRASALGFLLYVQEKKLCCKPGRGTGDPIALKWHETLTEFRPRLTSLEQPTEFTVRSWDPKTKKPVIGTKQKGEMRLAIGESRDGGALAQQAFHLEAPWLVTDQPVRKQSMAERMAQAVADSFSDRYVVAEGACLGNPGVVAGASVKLEAVGKRFEGTYFVTGAVHHFTVNQGYTTQFMVSGRRPSSLLGLLRSEAESIPTRGLVVGLVTNNDDPEGWGRVKVKYPWLSDDHESDWARVVCVGAGKERGVQFIPEIDDEVIVGFELGDIHHPYVLGGLWNGTDAPSKKSSEAVKGGKVIERIVRSRLGHVIVLNDSDDKPSVTVKTKAGHTILLDDTPGSEKIVVKDKTGSNTMTIDSVSNAMTIDITGDIKIKSKANISIEATANLEMKGMMVTAEGQAQAALKAPQVDVNGQAMVNISGGMVKLN